MADYNPFSDDVMHDPGTAYDYLLKEQPVHLFEAFDPPFYTLSRYEDVSTALRDIDTYSSHWGQGPSFTEPNGMLSDPPQHTFFRRLVQQAFTPKAIKALQGRIEALADELLDDVAGKESFELHDDYAFPLPVIIIAEVLGAADEDIKNFKIWSDASVEAMGSQDPAPYAPLLEELFGYLHDQVVKRRTMGSPPDDLITRLVQVEQDGVGLKDDEILSVLRQLLVGGNETTTSLITNAVWRLLQNRELWERLVTEPDLVAKPDLVDRAVEESLRYDPPVLGLYRTITKDVTLHGRTMPENAKVMLHYAAANRDPAVYDDPHTFSLDRPGKRHMAFGLGVHFCLGAELARMEARIALSTLVRRCPNLSLIDDGERIKPFFLWGRKRLPVKVG